MAVLEVMRLITPSQVNLSCRNKIHEIFSLKYHCEAFSDGSGILRMTHHGICTLILNFVAVHSQENNQYLPDVCSTKAAVHWQEAPDSPG